MPVMYSVIFSHSNECLCLVSQVAVQDNELDRCLEISI